MRTPLFFLLLMSSLCSGHAQKGLQCSSDLGKSITCEWDGVLQGTGEPVDPHSKCNITALVEWKSKSSKKYRPDAECDLIKQDDKIWKCVLHVRFKYRDYFSGTDKYNLEASCENYPKPAARLYFSPCHENSVVKLLPPEKPTIVNTTISWSFSHPVGNIDYEFQLQYRHDKQTWEEGNTIKVCCRGTSYLLQQDLKEGQRYWTRVRVISTNQKQKSKWSDWSPVESWETPANETKPTVDPQEAMESWLIWWAVFGAVAVLVFLVALMFMGSRMKSLLIPNPSKYFDGLHSVHEGNFKTWLGSFMAVDVLSAEQPFEQISPVEVLKAQVCSSFSNNRYFYGSDESVKCPPPPPSGPLQACQEFSPYDHMLAVQGSAVDANLNKVDSIAGVTRGNSSSSGLSSGSLGTIQPCLSYKDLTRLRTGAQSPDSGFSGGSMEEEEEEEEESHEESLEVREEESSCEPDETEPLAHQGNTFRGHKDRGPKLWDNIEWSLFKKKDPLPPLSPLHCSVPFQGPDHCSSPKALTQPEDSLDGLYGELEPSSDDYLPFRA